MIQVLIKPYKIVKKRIDYQLHKEVECKNIQETGVIKKRSMSLQKVNVIKNYYKIRKVSKDDDDLSNCVDVNDFTVIDKHKAEYKLLEPHDWLQIIQNKTFKDYSLVNIHVSLLSQQMDFTVRRQWWNYIADVDINRAKLQVPYSKLRKQPSAYEGQIAKDAVRSRIEENFFKNDDNLQSLKNVLVAYSNVDIAVGYVQGMNLMVANLLICYDMTVNDQELQDIDIIDNLRDENVFYILYYIMHNQRWRQLYLDEFQQLQTMINEFDKQFEQTIPDLYAHFTNEGIAVIQTCFQKHFLTLLMYQSPWSFSRIVIDLFLMEGENIIHRLLLAMLQYCKGALLKKNLPEIVNYLNNHMARDFYSVFQMKSQELLIKTLCTLRLIY